MRYCIDIDGTICTPGEGCGTCQYENATPKKDRIEVVNKLYDDGHYIIYFTARAMGRNSDLPHEEAGKKDSTMATGFALISIDPDEGTPSTALGPKMGMEATSLSRTLKNMEEKGLIERKPNPLDGRGVLIHLTPFGKEMRAFSKSVVLRFDEAVSEAVSEEDLKTFKRVAHTILELINSKKMNQKLKILEVCL